MSEELEYHCDEASTAIAYIVSQAALRRERLIDIDQEMMIVEAELRAYEDALRHGIPAACVAGLQDLPK